MMPYKHAGEIGDIWKHLPLCALLDAESPARYFETNSAFAKYKLVRNTQNAYGIFHVINEANYDSIKSSSYFRILTDIDLFKNNLYYGSPGLAMTLLGQKSEHFYFHDIEREPLDDILEFSDSLNIRGKVTISCGDSIAAFLSSGYCFCEDDFVLIDPYQPFETNDASNTFFDVFEKIYRSHAKVVLWYGYDTLIDKNKIAGKLQCISDSFQGTSIHTFDVWQRCMQQNNCKVNPGVPGCGIAIADMTDRSIRIVEKYLEIITLMYRNVIYAGERTSLCSGHLIL